MIIINLLEGVGVAVLFVLFLYYLGMATKALTPNVRYNNPEPLAVGATTFMLAIPVAFVGFLLYLLGCAI